MGGLQQRRQQLLADRGRDRPDLILFGADKFANVLVNWEKYLAPWIRDASPFTATHTMYFVGVIEISQASSARSVTSGI
jgi:hypothetical protein